MAQARLWFAAHILSRRFVWLCCEICCGFSLGRFAAPVVARRAAARLVDAFPIVFAAVDVVVEEEERAGPVLQDAVRVLEVSFLPRRAPKRKPVNRRVLTRTPALAQETFCPSSVGAVHLQKYEFVSPTSSPSKVFCRRNKVIRKNQGYQEEPRLSGEIINSGIGLNVPCRRFRRHSCRRQTCPRTTTVAPDKTSSNKVNIGRKLIMSAALRLEE
eukprot:3163212-Rhodomonas_salina.1